MRTVGVPTAVIVAAVGLGACGAAPKPKALSWERGRLTEQNGIVTQPITIQYRSGPAINNLKITADLEVYRGTYIGDVPQYADVLSVSGDPRCSIQQDSFDNNGFKYVLCGRLAAGDKPLTPTLTFRSADVGELNLKAGHWTSTAALGN